MWKSYFVIMTELYRRSTIQYICQYIIVYLLVFIKFFHCSQQNVICEQQLCSAQVSAGVQQLLSTHLTCHSFLRSQNSAMLRLLQLGFHQLGRQVSALFPGFYGWEERRDVWLSAGFSDAGRILPWDLWALPKAPC